MGIEKREFLSPGGRRLEETVGVFCDVCGLTCAVELSDGVFNREFLKLSTSWGYGSKWDTETWEAAVCGPCVECVLMPVVKFDRRGGF